jgi:hypothetical protein
MIFRDFKELLSEFNAHEVKYLIVGGYAVSFHGHPRATKDLDIVISADLENAKAVYAALAKFGAPVEGLKAEDLTEPGNFYRMGTPPVMVDILPRISGIDFNEAWQRRVSFQVDDTLAVPVISRNDLLAAKIAAGRPQDLADVADLREAQVLREDQHQLSASDSNVTDSIDELQRKGREKWLKRQSPESEHFSDSLNPTSGEHTKKPIDHGLDDDLDP